MIRFGVRALAQVRVRALNFEYSLDILVRALSCPSLVISFMESFY